MFEWDDLRIFIAAARAGAFAAASAKLGIDTTTVGRRVARLESALKATLFVRSPTGLQLTAAGAHLLEHALDAEMVMEAASRATRPDLVAGTIRISAAEGFGSAVLAPALPALSRAHPALRVELAANPAFLSPSRREVDMAITLSPPADPRLVVESLTPYQLALYASPEYLAAEGAPESLDEIRRRPLVGYVQDLIFAPELRYLDEIGGDLVPTLASSSIQAQRAIIVAGGGIGVLPCFLAEGLVPVLPGQALIERQFWLSTRRDVQGTARMRAVARWLRALVEAERSRLRPFSR